MERVKDILGTDDFIITDLQPEKTFMEIDDLSYLGVAPEAKRAVRMLSTLSIFYHIAIYVAVLQPSTSCFSYFKLN